ncbi:MBL fold metallo-hydrolase [bacterium]
MDIKIIYSNEALNNRFKTGWGFSCLINNKILFDTGENGESLLFNMSLMDIDINKIEKIVISHDHWDHTGGMTQILDCRQGLPVFGCTSFSQKFKYNVINHSGRLFESGEMVEIDKGIIATGEIGTVHKGAYLAEQSLIVKTDNGLSVITGCAHPGIANIAGLIKEYFPSEDMYLLMGGFHLEEIEQDQIDTDVMYIKSLGFQKIGPAHCTGLEALRSFKDVFGEDFISVSAGQNIIV